MRIAYLAQSYPPMISGASIVAEQIATGLATRGHQVLVIAASDREQPYVSIQKNLTVLRLNSVYNPLRVGQRFLLYPRSAVLKALHDFHPDVIHTHEPLQLGWLGIEYARRLRIPIILTIHQLPGFVARYLPRFIRICIERILWGYARWLSRNFTSLIVPTQTISTLIFEMTGLKTNAISNGLDLQTFYPPLRSGIQTAARQKWNLPPDVPLLLYAGRLDKDKSVDNVIRAAAPVLHRSEAHLVIVGDGRQKNQLVNLCKELGVSQQVHFTGFISKDQGLPEIYRLASLFVMASEIETQGIVLLEAAASGLPIVAVNATCIPEIVCDRENGLLVNPGDISDMSRAIVCILNNPSMAKAMGRASRKLVKVHNHQRTYWEYEKLYRRMIRQMRLHLASEDLLIKSQWRGRANVSK